MEAFNESGLVSRVRGIISSDCRGERGVAAPRARVYIVIRSPDMSCRDCCIVFMRVDRRYREGLVHCSSLRVWDFPCSGSWSSDNVYN